MTNQLLALYIEAASTDSGGARVQWGCRPVLHQVFIGPSGDLISLISFRLRPKIE